MECSCFCRKAGALASLGQRRPGKTLAADIYQIGVARHLCKVNRAVSHRARHTGSRQFRQVVAYSSPREQGREARDRAALGVAAASCLLPDSRAVGAALVGLLEGLMIRQYADADLTNLRNDYSKLVCLILDGISVKAKYSLELRSN